MVGVPTSAPVNFPCLPICRGVSGATGRSEVTGVNGEDGGVSGDIPLYIIWKETTVG